MAKKSRSKTSKKTPRTSKNSDKTITVSCDSDDGSSDEEILGSLSSLASQVARGIKEKLSPSSSRVINLRNRTVSHSEDDGSIGFVIDKLPSNVEKISDGNHTENSRNASVKMDKKDKKLGDNTKLSFTIGESDTSDDDDEEESNPEPKTKQIMGKKSAFEKLNLSSALQVDMDTDLYVDVDQYKTDKKPRPGLNRAQEEVMKKSVLTPDFEKKHEILPYSESTRQIKKKRQAARDMTKGKNWFDMKAPEMTEEMKNDLTIIQHRNVLDPKHFYKAPDRKVLPKFFQFGKVVDDPVDFYNGRVPKKQRKKTLVDELLADAELRRYNKRKYTEVIMEQTKRTGAYRDIKFPKKLKLKKKKK